MDRLSILFSLLLLFVINEIQAMTKQQLKNSLKLPKKTCMNKNQVTEEQVGRIEQGHFLEERNVMCYIACIYQMMSIVKNNKLNYDASMKQVDVMYPNDHKENGRASIDFCTPTTLEHKNDLCMASYYTAKCMYEFNPKLFIFP